MNFSIKNTSVNYLRLIYQNTLHVITLWYSLINASIWRHGEGNAFNFLEVLQEKD